MPRPTLAVGLPNFGGYFGGDWSKLLDTAQAAEAAGVHRLVVNDHVVMGRNTGAYSWGKFPVPPEAPWLEPLATLTALAGVTSTVRLATGVLIAPLRAAPLLAKSAATVDVLSGGRLDLGVGVGWQREEYLAAGLDFEQRGQMLTDTMAACRVLWSELPARFSSPTVNFEEIFCSPQPVQARLPIWFGGTLNSRNLQRIVTTGDGWIAIMGASLDALHEGSTALRQAVGHGRTVEVQAPAVMARDSDGVPDLEATMQSVPALVDAGVTDVYVNLQAFAREPAAAADALTVIVEQFEKAAS